MNRCGWIFFDAQGGRRPGGLISMWCSKFVVMEDSWNGKFSSSVVVKDVGLGYSWVVTNVYGPNDARLRDEFWAELEERSDWICLGVLAAIFMFFGSRMRREVSS